MWPKLLSFYNVNCLLLVCLILGSYCLHLLAIHNNDDEKQEKNQAVEARDIDPDEIPEKCFGSNGTRLLPLMNRGECIMENETVFFLETLHTFGHFHGCKLCSFESVSKQNPDRTLMLVIPPDFNLTGPTLDFLTALPNLFVTRMDFEAMVRASPVAHLLPEFLSRPLFYPSQLSDVVRVMLILQFGGYYLDSDVIGMKPLPQDLRNFIVKDYYQSEDLNNGVMHFEKDHPFLQLVLKKLSKDKFVLKMRNSIATFLFHSARREFCAIPNETHSNPMVLYHCQNDFKVMKKDVAHPFSQLEYIRREMISQEDFEEGIKDAFLLHYFKSTWRDFRADLRLRQVSPLMPVFERQCPRAVKYIKEVTDLDERNYPAETQT